MTGLVSVPKHRNKHSFLKLLTSIGIIMAAIASPETSITTDVSASSGDMVLVWSSIERDETRSIDWGDWDGDGDLDLAVGNYGQSNYIYRNDGDHLSVAWSSLENDYTSSIAWGDWDNDGDLDLVVGNSGGGGRNRVYRNDGNDLVLAWTSPYADTTLSIDWGDWDNDGDLDLAVGNIGKNYIYSNQSGVLTVAWESDESEHTASVAWGNWDGDGWMELAVGNHGHNQIYGNRGEGWTLLWTSVEEEDTMSVAWGDIDSDGDLDLAIGNYRGGTRVYIGDGSTMTTDWSTAGHWVYDVEWIDWDEDDDLDLSVAESYGQQRVFMNNDGELSLAWSDEISNDVRDHSWGDWDTDGDLDLAIGVAEGANRIYSNQGGNLYQVWESDELDQSLSVTWGDCDNDGDLDLATGNLGNPDRVYKNESGEYHLFWSSLNSDPTTSVEWGDWDNDGDLDLAVGKDGRRNQILQNDNCKMHQIWESEEVENTTDIAWVDWDNDGDLDLSVANDGEGQFNRLYENKRGKLEIVWSSPIPHYTQALAWGDVDNDGDLDLAIHNGGAASCGNTEIYLNTGNFLSHHWSSAEKTCDGGLAWGDIDLDSDLDLATGGYIYLNVSGILTKLDWDYPYSDNIADVAWGDWDSDGDLDLVTVAGNANGPVRVFSNTGTSFRHIWSSMTSQGWSNSIAWGDANGDGHLDLAVGNVGSSNKILHNTLQHMILTWSSSAATDTRSTAWGDLDADGDFDLALGNWQAKNQVYLNENGDLNLLWSSSELDRTLSVEWGDWDGDDDMDLAVGNLGKNRVYENSGGDMSLEWTSPYGYNTEDVAWADWDGDGDLDLAAANTGPNVVYVNDDDNLEIGWISEEMGYSTSVAWGDFDGDGDLDLAVGNGINLSNYPAENQIYVNTGGHLQLYWTSTEADNTSSVDWSDWDNDGDLDLAVGNDSVSDRIYENRNGDFVLIWSSPETDPTTSIAWLDWNNDGWSDLVVGSLWPYTSRIYENSNGLFHRAWSSPEQAGTRDIAAIDWDLDGDTDFVEGISVGPVSVYANNSANSVSLGNGLTTGAILQPRSLANPYSSAKVYDPADSPIRGTLAVQYRLFDREYHSARSIKAFYSLDNGSTWHAAKDAPGTVTHNLAASPEGTEHTFTWDVYGSDVFGQSDTTVFRLDVYQGFDGPGPYQYAFRTAKTLPFRLRGSQVRVLQNGQPMGNAMVFHSTDEGQSFQPYQDNQGEPFGTNPAGYLQGYGEIAVGDQLVALWPAEVYDDYTMYYSNAKPTDTGIEGDKVQALGIHNIEVSSESKLILFNLDISLEWDASKDQAFMEQLHYDLRRTSEALYDWTNGQSALGEINIYQNRENWLDSHIRIYATNRMRPWAAQGGIVTEPTVDPGDGLEHVVYLPGQVRMGSVWNRYGSTEGDLGEDWPLALAHELGHYLFYLDDNYIGYKDGVLTPVDTCPGAMHDPYAPDESEFHSFIGWYDNCWDTLSNQTTSRPDWFTMSLFYGMKRYLLLSFDMMPLGPSTLPLVVTTLFIHEPSTSTALDAPHFYLNQEDGGHVQPGASARAILFQDEHLIDLGHPTQDRVLARGAAIGDRLCVFEPDARHLGCERIAQGDEQLQLVSFPDWQPEITVSPVTSTTIEISVGNLVQGLGVYAQLYPMNDPATDVVALDWSDDEYNGVFTTEEPALEGYFHVWVNEAEPKREAITDYTIGGSPGYKRGGGGYKRGGGGYKRGGGAPGVSADGQAILFGENLVFDEGEFLVLQTTTHIPSPPSWGTVVGSGYRLSTSANAPDLTSSSLSLTYFERDVPPGEEDWIKMYHWDGTEWQPLDTKHDRYYNFASAKVQGEGLYALMSTIEIPLYGPGWNNFAYPVNESREVDEALRSIDGYYTIVYGYHSQAIWQVYDPAAPAWVNDLDELQFGRGYWTYLNESATLKLRGGSMQSQSTDIAIALPPATIYGVVAGSEVNAPHEGMMVNALVNGKVCGSTVTEEQEGRIIYRIQVLAADSTDPSTAGCGALSRTITFTVDGVAMTQTVDWDNRHTREVMLSDELIHYFFVPFLAR